MEAVALSVCLACLTTLHRVAIDFVDGRSPIGVDRTSASDHVIVALPVTCCDKPCVRACVI